MIKIFKRKYNKERLELKVYEVTVMKTDLKKWINYRLKIEED